MFDNIILLTDSYKVSHAVQYPPGTTSITSYFESRGGEFNETVFAGLQYFLKRYLVGEVVTEKKIAKAASVLSNHLGPGVFNPERWQYIVEKHKGWLPIQINAVPEGTVVPAKNVLMTITNTDPNCYWLVNYLETLLVQVWYPTTVATISREMKKLIKRAAERSGDPDNIDFKLHDFGFRGVSSVESAGLGGFGHLINFKGTDTMAALEVAQDFYSAPPGGAGFSIPASEHSTITSWGKDKELDAYRNMLTQYPSGLVACVSDSWDIYNACKHLWGRELKTQIMNRQDGTLVIRPDSGEPTEVLPKILDILTKEFGCETNDKGYKVLPKQVRVIQGDGIKRNTLGKILDSVMNAGYSVDNLAFGSGGGLLQDCNRDTMNFAFKCSHAEGQQGDTKWARDVFKAPATAGWKKSKSGHLALVNHPIFETVNGTGWATVPEHEARKFGGNLLQTVYLNGELLVDQRLDSMRNLAKL